MNLPPDILSALHKRRLDESHPMMEHLLLRFELIVSVRVFLHVVLFCFFAGWRSVAGGGWVLIWVLIEIGNR